MRIKNYIAVAAAAAVVGGGMLLAAGSASATAGAAPAAWEPDPGAVGSVALFNAAGQPVTQGTDWTNAFAYAEASNNTATAGSKAVIQYAFPDPANPTSAWFVKAGFVASNYPNAAAPAPLNTATNPLFTVTGNASSLSAAHGAGVNSSTAGYTNVLQIRLTTSGGLGGSTNDGTYWASDLLYNPTTGAWTEIASDNQVVSHTALVASPTTSSAGSNVTLTATETVEATGNPGTSVPVAGSYKFFDGATQIGTTQAVAGGAANTAAITVNTLTVGAHNLSAVFTPTDAANDQGSTGFASETVTGPATQTTLTIPTPVFTGTPVNMTATVTLVAGGAGVTAGSVAFKDGATTIATVPSPGAAGGVYTAPFTFTSAGTHNITAVFTPDVPANDAPSTSAVDSINVTAPATGACQNELTQTTNCTDVQSIEAGIPTGTITITTPYNGTSCGDAASTASPNIGTTETITTGTAPDRNSLTDSTPGCVNGVLNIGTLHLTADDSQFKAFTTFQDIAVTDNLSANQNWTLSAQASTLADASPASATSRISGENLGLTALTENVAAEGANHYVFTTPGGAITATDAPVPSAPVDYLDGGTAGLGNAPHILLSSTPGLGSYVADGTITLIAPTTTESGLFTGTITFTLATS